MKKPDWVIEKERAKRAAAAETVWLFGIHAVRDALVNPARTKLRLVLTRNAADRLGDAVAEAGLPPEIVEPRAFDKAVGLDPESVHQGAALLVKPLDWGRLDDLAAAGQGRPLLVLLDRVTDPHRGLRRPRRHRPPAPFRAGNRGAGQDRQRRARTPALSARRQPGRGDGAAEGHGLYAPRP